MPKSSPVYDKAVAIAVEVLGCDDKKAPKKANQILEHAEKLVREKKLKIFDQLITEEDLRRIEKSWSVYLSKAAKERTSRLVPNPEGHGYLLGMQPEESAVKSEGAHAEKLEEKSIEEEDKRARKYQQQEKRLYPIFKDWALTYCDRAKDNSSKRKGGQWCNPDIVGFNIINDPLGHEHIEILTIEVKVSDSNWQTEFFQAVAHKRFSNRAYFAYAAPKSHKPDQMLRRYAEKYTIGVLYLPLEESDFEKFDQKKNIDLSKYEVDDIKEIWPASFEIVSSKEVVDFLHDLEITNRTDLYDYGDELD